MEGANLIFHGAAKQVTGSMFLLKTASQKNVLIDCGMDMETDEEFAGFPFHPRDLDCVMLTHAHLDHSGHLPNLVQEGFEGEIYCTYGTYQLIRILLFDAARINQRKKENSGTRRTGGARKYLYGPKDVEECLQFVSTIDFHQEVDLGGEISFHFNTAGHLLGAANIVLSLHLGDDHKTIVFSGDMGRNNYPLLPDPEPLPTADVLICECTYGNRLHIDNGKPEELLEPIIHKACVDTPGRLIIPAFSVGRTQSLLFTLNKLQKAGRLPRIKIFTDSPLARKSTQIYEDFVPFLHPDAQKFQEQYGSLFDLENLVYLDDLNSANEIQNYLEPCIIISSSGMVKGGKIGNHIALNLENPMCTILFIGYCAQGTMGHQLLQGRSHIYLRGERKEIRAEILSTDVFSGHADFNEIIKALRSLHPRPEKIFLVHGEIEALENMLQTLRHDEFDQVVIAESHQPYPLFHSSPQQIGSFKT